MSNPASNPASDHTPTIAVIGGDGIGPEVTAEAIKVLKATVGENTFSFTDYALGADNWLRTGEVLPDGVLDELKQADAIVLGAVGAAPGSTQVPSGLLERGLLLRLRFELDQGVNLRPSRLYPGVPTPLSDAVITGSDGARKDIDFVVVREGTEGLYCGNGGAVRVGTPQELATEVSINTAFGVERTIRDAYERATRRRNRLTLLHKHNVLVNAGRLWNRLFTEIGREYPQVETSYLHIDAAMIALVVDPSQFDVIVTDNLFGDIVTDLAAAVTGGIGLAASANINTSGQYPSMFEPVHGSAPDIAGRGIANPTAAISSMALLLDHLGRPDDARRIEDAVTADIAAHGAEQRSTTVIGDAIAAAVR